MTPRLTRRRFVGGIGGVIASRLAGLSAASTVAQESPAPHYMVLVTLRGGFDATMSLDAKDQSAVGEGIFCGYRPEERIRGTRRLFGPLIGGLEAHDDDLCILHGVRSDTTSHPDGLAMLTQGGVRPREGNIATLLGQVLPGNAPIANLDMTSPDGDVQLRAAPRPVWADVRDRIQEEQGRALVGVGELIAGGVRRTVALDRFLSAATADAAALDAEFDSVLGRHFRFAFQAVRGNWARCIQVASRGLWYDSHSDNVRFQQLRQPPIWRDLARLISMLKSTRNEHGSLFDQTTIAVFSELGRFPRLNQERGKDHFPENAWLLAGNGVRPGVSMGRTGADGRGMTVDFRTGDPSGAERRPMFIDNVFASLIAIAGVAPETHGYGRDAIVPALLSGATPTAR